jgi:N-acetylglucosamine-6-sulfatase
VDLSTYVMWGYTLNENGTFRTYGDRAVEDPALYQTDVYRDKAVEAIRRRAPARRPFYLSVAFLAPHSEGLREFGTSGATVRSAPRHRGRLTRMPIPRLPGFNEADLRDKPRFFADAFPLLDSAGVELAHNYYRSRAESLLAVDEAVAAIVRALKRSGELDRTLVVFASDNGFLTGEHRVPFGKYLVYEPSIRVPTIIRGPGIQRGATARELVVNADLAATIVDTAGATPGRILDGRSMLPFARDPSRRTRRPILLETGTPARGDLDQDGAVPPFLAAPPIPRYQAIRTERFVHVEYGDGQRELYDLVRDPAQLRSRASDPAYRKTRRVLARRLDMLRDCRGRACRTGMGRIPGPSR